MKHYILMCDIIGSRKQEDVQLMENFKKCTSFINSTYCTRILSPLTITLGDEFQGVIKDLESLVEIIIGIEEYLIDQHVDFKLRYVGYFGEIGTEINRVNAHEMLGKGLTDARKILNQLKKEPKRFVFQIENDLNNLVLNEGFNIFQNIVDKWKIQEDHELISNLIHFEDYKIVASTLNKNRSLVWKREKTLNISTYLSIKNILKSIVLQSNA